MDELIRAALAGEEAYVVGGAVRDEALGRPVLDVDVACREPAGAARAYRQKAGGVVFLLSERHGAWRVAQADGSTVDFTLLRGTIEDDLAGRDFTVNALARPLEGGDAIDPHGGRDDLATRTIRAVADTVFTDDPLRLLRAVRLEDELGFRLDAETEALVRRDASLVARSAGERILAELLRLSPDGYRRLAELDLLAPLGGDASSLARAGRDPSARALLVAALGRSVERLPISNQTRRYARILLSARRPGGRRRPLDPSFPPSHRALGARGADLSRPGAISRTRCWPPVRPSRPSRSSAATSSGCRPGRRSGDSSS